MKRRKRQTRMFMRSAVVAGIGLSMLGVSSDVGAKLDPIRIVTSQVVRPNVLIAFDTSGSMSLPTTGVSFSSSNVLGGDCYNGNNCGGSYATSTSSSRLAIAKSVIKEVVAGAKDLVNFGLLAFNQTKYFPYVKSTTTTTTHTDQFTKTELVDAGGWASGPKSSFTSGGVTYTLKTSNNSIYKRSGKDPVDHDWCGETCVFGSPARTYSYQGSYYTWTQTVVTTSGTKTMCYCSAYLGASVTNPTNAQCKSTATGSSTCATGTYYYRAFERTYANVDTSSYTCAGSYEAPVCGDTSSVSSCTEASRQDAAIRVPIDTTETTAAVNAVVTKINQWMQPQDLGGLVAHGGTPTGCSLKSDITPSGGTYYDAYAYLTSVLATDALTCRKNYVILVTDGDPNGPGDSGCTSSSCASTSLSGCTCKSVLAAKALKDKNIPTYVIGFSSDVTGSTILNNIGRAGGTCRDAAQTQCAYYATDEDTLTTALRDAVYLAAKGDYATSPPSVATSTGSTYAGDVAFLASAEFPSWNGHLRAYDTVHTDSAGAPILLWDAGAKLATRPWNQRRVYTYHPTTKAIIPLIESNIPSSAAISFLATSLGSSMNTYYGFPIGASDEERKSLIRFVLGKLDPNTVSGADKAWKLGAMLNSTAAAHGRAIDINLPGHVEYTNAQDPNRPKMVYAGADDGMLHAFYLEDGASGSGQNKGDEAWAIIPPNMWAPLAKLFLMGAQPTDPDEHMFGMASSPKIYDLCQGACNTAADWRTMLISGQGKGGSTYFGLDITAAPSSSSPFSVVWDTLSSSTFQPYAGESWSVPAFGFAKNSSGTIISYTLFGSGYDGYPADAYTQGRALHMLSPIGANIAGPHVLAAPTGTTVTYAVMADTVVAKDPDSNLMIAAYQADLGGRLWRTGNWTGTPTPSTFYNAGTSFPFYYSPAVMVKDATTSIIAMASGTYDDPENNVTSSSTQRIFLLKDSGGSSVSTAPFPFVRDLTSVCRSGCSGGTCPSGCPKFDGLARPVSSPVLVNNVKTTPAKLEALVLIYQPASWACAVGSSSLVVFEIPETGSIVQTQALAIPGNGKASGIFIGGGGQVLIGTSGANSNVSTIKVVAGTPVLGGSTTPGTNFTARVLGVREVSE